MLPRARARGPRRLALAGGAVANAGDVVADVRAHATTGPARRLVAATMVGSVVAALAIAPPPASASASVAAAPAAPAAPAAQAASMPPAEVASALPAARLVGQGTLRWFGLAVYEARLWAPDGFDGQRFESHPFALELRYLRRLDGSAITDRALDEMRRSGPIAETEAAAWRAAMRTAFPDVAPGDRLTGVNDPAKGARFHFNGRVTGVLADPVFARRFYAVWLGTQTSQPALRAQLLGAAR